MAHHEVLLIKPVEGLGAEGDQVKVRAGYARNYLIPRAIAVPLTSSNRKSDRGAQETARRARGAGAFGRPGDGGPKLEKTRIAFAVKTGEGGKMFGAVTASDIHEKLAQAGLEIEKRKILLHTPVKALGQHTVKIKLHADVSVDLNFDVVSENPIVQPGG